MWTRPGQLHAVRTAAEAAGLDFVRLFGSARRSPAAARDVDLAIGARELSAGRLLELREALEAAIERPVDLLQLRPGLNPRLVGEIAASSQALWEAPAGRAVYALVIDRLLAVAEDELLAFPKALQDEGFARVRRGCVSPEVLRSTLGSLQHVLLDLMPHVDAPRAAQERAHYEIERQVQLATDFCAAMARRVLVLEGVPVPAAARATFEALGRAGRIPVDLAARLGNAAGLRNLLVHVYGDIDQDRFFTGLESGYAAFVAFADWMRAYVHGR